MRTIALSKGYSLNEYGFTSISGKGDFSDIKKEIDIFKFLDMKWVEPKDR